jgi:hypothetical protein
MSSAEIRIAPTDLRVAYTLKLLVYLFLNYVGCKTRICGGVNTYGT